MGLFRFRFVHKTASYLVNNYNQVHCEDLNTQAIIDKGFSKDMRRRIYSAAWSKFFSFLKYKAENAGILFSQVDPRYTSQICSECKAISPKDLSVRVHKCSECKIEMCRDLNASKNILLLGLDPKALSVPKARLEKLSKAKSSL